MSALLPLRSYQRDALDKLNELLTTREVTRPAVVLPTGAGKTVMFAHLAKEQLEVEPGRRVLVLVHTDELVRQAVNKIRAVAPHLSVGVVKATENETEAAVIVGSVQTLRRPNRRAAVTGVGMVVVDECHHATARSYREILEHYGCLGTTTTLLGPGRDMRRADAPRPVIERVDNLTTPAIGFTATLARGDGESLGSIWQTVAYSRDIAWMVRRRYLIVPRGRRVTVPDLDLSTVRTTRGDFREEDLGEALAESLAPQVVARQYNVHAMHRCAECIAAIDQVHADQGEWEVPAYCPNETCGTATGAGRSGIAFFPTVASAYIFADAFNAEGIKTEVVHGAMPRDQRRAVLERLESGVTQLVANCMVLTEGFDSPRVSCIVVGRPTRSKPLYVQMVGRGLRVDPSRPYEDQDCLILDVTGAAERHDLRTIADLSERAVKHPRDGQTLIELEDALDAAESGAVDAPDYYAGPVASRDFDPLAARSARTWGRTVGGTYFVPAGKDAFVFLYEEPPGTFAVCWRVKDARSPLRYVCCAVDGVPAAYCSCRQLQGRRGGMTAHTGLDLEMAMAWGEDFAVDMGADPFETFSKKKAPWRRKQATSAARSYARSLGIKVTDEQEIKAGELSDRMNRVIASRAIDPSVARVRQQQGVPQ